MDLIQTKIDLFNKTKDFNQVNEINNDIDDEINKLQILLSNINDIEEKEHKKYNKYSIDELNTKINKTDDINKMIKIYESALFKLNNS